MAASSGPRDNVKLNKSTNYNIISSAGNKAIMNTTQQTNKIPIPATAMGPTLTTTTKHLHGGSLYTGIGR